MQEKAEQGIWPTKTPLGYRNITGWDGRKVIATDPEVAPLISKLFEWYATRRHSLQEVARRAREAGLVHRKSGAKVLAWVREALHASHADERHEHEEAIRRLQAEHKRLGDRINAMYLDKLDGRVDVAFFDRMSAEWREEQNHCLREVARHEAAEQSDMDEGVKILELARNAQRLFERQEPREKRRLLNFVLSNCSWDDGNVVATSANPLNC